MFAGGPESSVPAELSGHFRESLANRYSAL